MIHDIFSSMFSFSGEEDIEIQENKPCLTYINDEKATREWNMLLLHCQTTFQSRPSNTQIW